MPLPHDAETLFHEALDRRREERAAFLARACAGNRTLQLEVESLIEAHEEAPAYLDAPCFLPAEDLAPQDIDKVRAGATAPALVEGPGTVIGRYRLVERIGQGGFGVVYRAEQREPIRRLVALKIVKLGMDTRQFIARFEAERQALAMMDHPCIARVLDAGATDQGRPYLVMELVDGVSITEFCDTRRMSVRERVALFAQVCQAVQHAHQKGIIHRDIKPSNILVARQDDAPRPKVIDFGVAKALERPLAANEAATEVGQFIGTPRYMSPEQAEGGAQDVDTRSDVYSLGVVLYELLAGVTPFDFGDQHRPRIQDIRRMILEEDPAKPSTRFSRLAGDRSSIASRRNTDSSGLSSALRGELDWIAMKALERDRSRRYESASALADDLRRHLSDEPVSASPPSTFYRFRKMARRHRAAVAVAAAVAMGLLGTAGALSWAARQRVRAALAEASQAQAAQQLAEQKSRELQTVIDFQRSMLDGIDAESTGEAFFREMRTRAMESPAWANLDDEVRAARLAELDGMLQLANATDIGLAVIDGQILQKAEKAIDRDFATRPLIQAALKHQLSDVLVGIGLYESAERLQASAHELRVNHLGENHPDALEAMSGVGDIRLRRGDYAGAEAIHRDILARIDAAGLRPTLYGKSVVADLARALKEQGEFAAAEALFRETYQARERELGARHRDTIAVLGELGSTIQAQGRNDEALEVLRDALARLDEDNAAHQEILLNALHDLALALQSQDRHAEAEPLYRRKLEASMRMLGSDHPSTLVTANNLAAALRATGRLEEAEAHFRMAFDGERRIHGDDHPSVFVTMNNLAGVLLSQGKFAEVADLLREALAGFERTTGADHPDAIVVRSNLAAALLKLGKAEEAAALASDAVERAGRVLGENHWIHGVALSKWGLARLDLRRYSEAETKLLRSHGILMAALGYEHEHTRRVADGVEQLYKSWMESEPSAEVEAKLAAWRERLVTTESP